VNSGHISDRVYGALRARLVERAYLPGQRLDPALLAGDLASSITPVRDALHRLTGENLVTSRPSEGFFVPAVDQIALADLRDWSIDIVRAATAAAPAGWRAQPPGTWPNDAAAHAEATMDLFARIVAGSTNPEHHIASAQAQARLAPAHRAEWSLIEGLAAEMTAIATAASEADRPRLRRLIELYRRRRARRGAEIVRLLYRPA